MNYRHVYHAGNFADVMKHAVLALVVEHLKRKDKAFRVIDTHAGTGSYDLTSEEAQKTGEWRGGIGRLMEAKLEPEVSTLLEPYLGAVRAANPEGGLGSYPGSPVLVRHLLRRQDRLTAIELHEHDAERLKERFAGDIQTRVIHLDGWLALGAHLPPKEKRGLVLVDPSYEVESEFDRLVDGLRKAHRRWPGGVYALWYPIKKTAEVEDFRKQLKALAIPKILDAMLMVRKPGAEPRLDGSGLILVNPPYRLDEELKVLLPALAKLLADGAGATGSMEWLAGEGVSA